MQPRFSPNGQQVLFIDKPGEAAPVGIYGVNLGDPLPATPKLVEEVIGFRSDDRAIVATLDGNLARFTNELTGQSWRIDTGGNWPRYAPDNSRILWVAADKEGPYDQRQSDIWLANLDGSDARRLLSLYGGGYQDWLPDANRLLLVGRDIPSAEDQNLLVYDISDNQTMTLASHKRIRGIELSPDGTWVAYFVDFADEPEERGLWVVNTDDQSKQKLDLPGFGGYRWRDDHTLLLIPIRESADESMQIWAIDVASNQSAPLTTENTPYFSIFNGDWIVSPSGKQVVFVNSLDHNLWLIELPQGMAEK